MRTKKSNMKTDLQKIEDIVLDLENDAESANEHSLSTLYRSLAEVLVEELTDSDALLVMKKIRSRNGFLP